MWRLFILLVCINAIYATVSGQSRPAISGIVFGVKYQPLIGASVILYPPGKGTVTDAEGRYSIEDLEKGTYEVEVSFIGYKTYIDTIRIEGDITYDAKLTFVSLSLQEVIVSENYAESRKKEESLSMEIVSDEFLKKNLGGSLMKTLERLPGVTAIDIGAGQSKPVIRGLGFNRVVVVETGIKHEGQQWGADHGLEIDQFALDNIEVIKGPSSLEYGSDAIAGVIHVIQKSLPSENSISGTIDLTGKANNNLMGTSIRLSGRKKSLFGSIRATILDYGDYKIPADSVDIYSYRAPLFKNHLRNTSGNDKNLHLSFGYMNHIFQTRFFVSNVNSKSGFFANAHGLEPRNVDTNLHDRSSRDIHYPFKQVNHFKIINKSQWSLKELRFESNLGFQHNFRQEWSQYVDHGYMPPMFPDTLAFDADLERQFYKDIYSGNLKASYQLEKTSFAAGFNNIYEVNNINGRGFIIPAFRKFNMGGYVLVKHAFSESSLMLAGLRYDHCNIKTDSYFDWFSSPDIKGLDTIMTYLQRAEAVNRYFSNLSWSVGYHFNPENFSLRLNAGKSFRIPIAKELAANGVNYHNFSYEVGNPGLSPEISYQFDIGIEYNHRKFAIGATPFLNYFSNYIYLNPSAEHDRLYGNGNQIFYYTQSEVFRYGGEIHTHHQLTKEFQLGLIGEYVYARQLSGKKKGFTLPFSPPASALFNVRYQRSGLYFFENVYISVDYRITASQNNIVPPEDPTQGYQLINVGLGSEIKLKNQSVVFAFQAQNLLNSKYFKHTSYYRLINIPEPGRNFILNITIPFHRSFNHNSDF